MHSQLKAYAATHGNTVTIDEGMYSGAAANNETLMLQLQQYYDRDQNIPGMIMSIQVLFPVSTMILVFCIGLLVYFITSKDTESEVTFTLGNSQEVNLTSENSEEVSLTSGNSEEKGKEDITDKAIWLSVSMTAVYIVVVVIVLDLCAIGYLYDKLFETAQIYNDKIDHIKVLYGIPWTAFVFDLCSFVGAIAAIIIYTCRTCTYTSCKCKRSTCNCPHNITRIFCMCTVCRKLPRKIDSFCKRFKIKPEILPEILLAITSIMCALFSFSNHIFYVVIAFLNDTQYASNITVYYFIVFVVYLGTFFLISKLMLSIDFLYNNPIIVILVCVGVAVALFGYQIMLTIYFVLIPIRESISKTPNSIFVVYQIPLMLIAALVVYKTLVTKTGPEKLLKELVNAHEKKYGRNTEEPKTETLALFLIESLAKITSQNNNQPGNQLRNCSIITEDATQRNLNNQHETHNDQSGQKPGNKPATTHTQDMPLSTVTDPPGKLPDREIPASGMKETLNM